MRWPFAPTHLHPSPDTLRTAGHLLLTAPRPRQFTQADPTDPASLQAQPPPPLPPPFAHLNHHPSLRHLAEGTPLAVSDLLRIALQEPIGVWLAALDAAKVGALESVGPYALCRTLLRSP